mmetsp:Transcript_72179/g.192983  ORF Transcript_72179/g.192983 Transcript_72179/m.192983 type:complete len:174 (-) Transcript_72179:136-657(-)
MRRHVIPEPQEAHKYPAPPANILSPFNHQWMDGLTDIFAGLLQDPEFCKPHILAAFFSGLFSFSFACGFAVMHAWESASFALFAAIVSIIVSLSFWKYHSLDPFTWKCALIFGGIASMMGLGGLILFTFKGYAFDEGVLSVTSRSISSNDSRHITIIMIPLEFGTAKGPHRSS